MSSGRAWTMGLQEQARQQESLKTKLAAKHRYLMKNRKLFNETFKTNLKKFYKDVITGFDIIAFDDWLMTQDEEYRKANNGELGEDADCSMKGFITKKYGEEAAKLVESFID